MSQSLTYFVELFIKTLAAKHQITFQKEKQQYFRVLFDTYLNGQGNPNELKEYIEAGVQDPQTVNIIQSQVKEWQRKAQQARQANEAKKKHQLSEKQKLEQFVKNRSQKLKKQRMEEEQHAPVKKTKSRPKPEKKQQHPDNHQSQKIPIEPNSNIANQQGEVQGQNAVNADKKNLKHQLQQQGKQKCKFYPYCKNLETCPYFHPSQRCTFFPHCRFGNNCLYEHEACKFKQNCKKPNCAYAHPYKKPNPMQQFMKSFMTQNSQAYKFKKPRQFKPRNQQGGQQQAPEPQQ